MTPKLHLNRLTDATVRALPHPEAGQQDYHDPALPGFSVRVGKRTKTFRLMAGSGANRTHHTLGRYPETSLGEARERARDILAEQRVNRREPRSHLTFEEALETFYATHLEKNRAATQKERRRILDRHLRPLLADIPLSEIKTGDLVRIFDRMLKTPSEANHLFAASRVLFRWSVKRRLIDRSPLENCDQPATENPQPRALTPDELRQVWIAADTLGGNFPNLIRCLILTAQRSGQIRHLRADMIDRQKQTITWPAEMMKAGRPHTIPLTPMVSELIGDRIGLCFPTKSGRPYTLSGAWKQTLDAVCPIPHWTIHNLRHTWATISAEELSAEPHIIDAVLAHQSGTAVSRIYNRAAYLKPMRNALEAYELWLTARLSNVGAHQFSSTSVK